MKNSIALIMLLFASQLLAQDIDQELPASIIPDLSNMDQQQLQGMMQQVQAMQACVAKIDQQKLEVIRKESEQITADIKSMCAAGERDAAQSKAIAFGKKTVNEPVMLELQACAGIMNLSIPQSAWAELENENTQVHVCNL
jgi:TolA-binding protein